MNSATVARSANASMVTLVIALTITYVALKIWPTLGLVTYFVFAAGFLACCRPTARNVLSYTLIVAIWPLSGLIGYVVALSKIRR